jgi:phosphatidylinositol glycan class F
MKANGILLQTSLYIINVFIVYSLISWNSLIKASNVLVLASIIIIFLTRTKIGYVFWINVLKLYAVFVLFGSSFISTESMSLSFYVCSLLSTLSFNLEDMWKFETSSCFVMVGVYLSAIVIPLDWDRYWQKWPIPGGIGAAIGYISTLVLLLLKKVDKTQ